MHPDKSKSTPLDRGLAELRDGLTVGNGSTEPFQELRTISVLRWCTRLLNSYNYLHCAFSNLRYTFSIVQPMKYMTNALKQAIQKVSKLPPAAQERIGEELLLHVEKVRRLRSQLETAADSLDHNGGRVLKIADVIKRARARYGKA